MHPVSRNPENPARKDRVQVFDEVDVQGMRERVSTRSAELAIGNRAARRIAGHRNQRPWWKSDQT